VHGIDADHGPTEIVWCRDWRGCHAARGADDPGDDEPTPPADEPDCGGGDGCGRQ
jgi:hypothetical protein